MSKTVFTQFDVFWIMCDVKEGICRSQKTPMKYFNDLNHSLLALDYVSRQEWQLGWNEWRPKVVIGLT
jgi:hypothetical protein